MNDCDINNCPVEGPLLTETASNGERGGLQGAALRAMREENEREKALRGALYDLWSAVCPGKPFNWDTWGTEPVAQAISRIRDLEHRLQSALTAVPHVTLAWVQPSTTTGQPGYYTPVYSHTPTFAAPLAARRCGGNVSYDATTGQQILWAADEWSNYPDLPKQTP
ncbi:hypothetical protein [Hymenobacter latericus]|uniref:hypothetical protein n=1 Tax=Hymenobacter sp. YIM 151858-1 TaxID=2987688 RepID=UPI0022271FFF|nr:hypothetical protein [Hymenobacter sp. YIM 151858-1]UYZ60106.1 hypothetical protein OIS50_04720 [Hymenobacter sp. YIM 151858-1]